MMDGGRKSSSSSTSGSGSGETRMLERRVSNNRADLNGDQRMNYVLNWFQGWSELQKSDFVPVLAFKMSDKDHANDVTADDVASLNLNGHDDKAANGTKAPSLFECQVKLFKDWFSGWSDDQKNYLVLRLQAIDADFFAKYEAFEARKSPEKDYFEPGVPPELVRKSSKSVLGPHLATFNAHESLPGDSQPKSFMSCSNMSGDSLSNCNDHSSTVSEETTDEEGDVIKKPQPPPPPPVLRGDSLTTIAE